MGKKYLQTCGKGIFLFGNYKKTLFLIALLHIPKALLPLIMVKGMD
jgi:hypothetical protein